MKLVSGVLLFALTSLSAAELSFTERMDQNFLKLTPKSGEMLPEAEGIREDGQPFHLSSARGSPLVLVTGCLT